MHKPSCWFPFTLITPYVTYVLRVQLSLTWQKNSTKKASSFWFLLMCDHDLYFFLGCFRGETRLARPSLFLSLCSSRPHCCLRARSLAISRPRVSLPRSWRCCPGNVSFHHPSALSRGSGGKKVPLGEVLGVEVGWWWGGRRGGFRLAEHKKELVRAPVSNGPGTLDYSCQKIVTNVDSSGVPHCSGGSPSVQLP